MKIKLLLAVILVAVSMALICAPTISESGRRI